MKFYTVYDLQCYFSPKVTQKSAGDYFRDTVKVPIFRLKKSHNKCDFCTLKILCDDIYVPPYGLEYFFLSHFLCVSLLHGCHMH